MTELERTEHNNAAIRSCLSQYYLLGKEHKKYDLFDKFKKQLLCITCGNRDTAVLDFHHRNPLEKEFNISMRKNGNLEKVLKEAIKCDVLCSNCHRKYHEQNRKQSQ